MTEAFATVRLVLVIACAATAWWFVVRYDQTSHGDWRKNQHGKHLMLFTASLGLILTYIVTAILGWVPAVVWPYASTVIYLIILGLLIWRAVLLERAQRRH